MQGLMWRAVNSDGTLTYSFVESLTASYPFYFMRFLGGTNTHGLAGYLFQT
jgi:cytochrome c oxidase cbb3-type subunit 1